MNQDRANQLRATDNLVQGERRKYNNRLRDYAEGKIEEYNGEDLLRIVGELECAHNHLLAALASDGDIYCVLKHLSAAIILAGELGEPDVEVLYEAMTIVTDGRIEPCASCVADAAQAPSEISQ